MIHKISFFRVKLRKPQSIVNYAFIFTYNIIAKINVIQQTYEELNEIPLPVSTNKVFWNTVFAPLLTSEH